MFRPSPYNGGTAASNWYQSVPPIHFIFSLYSEYVRHNPSSAVFLKHTMLIESIIRASSRRCFSFYWHNLLVFVSLIPKGNVETYSGHICLRNLYINPYKNKVKTNTETSFRLCKMLCIGLPFLGATQLLCGGITIAKSFSLCIHSRIPLADNILSSNKEPTS